MKGGFLNSKTVKNTIMNKLILLFFTILVSLNTYAQPANNTCSGAVSVTPDGTCYAGTTTAATDNWTGTVGCQSGNGHPDVWYTFVATGNTLDITVTNGTQANNIEFTLVEDVSPPCGSLFIAGSACGASPLSATITGLTNGATYYYTISTSGAAGTFSTCVTSYTPPPVPGQDCATASNLCDNSSFSIGSVASGSGIVSGNGSEEDMSAISCFGGDERQSQWYKFTAADAGSLEFSVEPTNWTAPQTGDDYDWVLYDITTSGCALNSGSPTQLGCNWSGCLGATGLSPTDMGLIGGTDWQNNNPPGPGSCVSATGFQWDNTAVTTTAGNTYLLLIDNFSATNSGFTFTFGGTATIGPQAAFTITAACGGDNTVSVSADYPTTVAGWTYTWDWGDLSTSTGTTANHLYAASGPYTVNLTVVDPLGCSASLSQNINCTLPIELLSFNAKYNGKDVDLNWETASEIDNDFFTVQRSSNGLNYEDLIKIDGAPSGNSTTLLSYSTIDQHPLNGTSYYRLKQTDFDGTVSFSDPVAVHINLNFEELEIYPNPASTNVSVAFVSYNTKALQIKMYDITGKLVKNDLYKPVVGGNIYSMEVKDLPKGIYSISLIGEKSIQTRKLILE